MFYHLPIAGKLNAPTELDLYAVLGVEPDANEDHIRRQYKRLAKTFHPDLNPDPEAGARMKAINEAYGVLGDAARRATYDSMCGMARWGGVQRESDGHSGSGLRRFEGELDNEMSIAEMLTRKKASRDLLVRKTDYRQYYVSSLDHQSWYRVSVDNGCHCPDALGVAGPFGCKHWYAMEAFRNNGDKAVEPNAWSVAGRR
jgi:curved DNA-binding protein CbpA